MAKRYRYAFTKKRQSVRGQVSAVAAVASVLLFGAAIGYALFAPKERFYVTGGICLFAALLSVYGFFAGLAGFSEKDKSHTAGMFGSIANGLIMIVWLGLYLGGR